MPLTSIDIRRISDSGKKDFYHKDSRQLINIDGRCIFLTRGGECTVYDIRPEGCRLYPMIMLLPSREPIMDEECPHGDDFIMEPEDVVDLNRLVDRLLEEEL